MRPVATPRGRRPRARGAASIRPNILLVVVDCARADIWLEEGSASLAPNLTGFRRESLTLPVCIAETSGTTPNFATLLTGLYSPRHGVRMILGHALGPKVPLLTEDLARLGYHTYAEVTGPLIPDIGLDRGFEDYRYRAPCDYLHTAWGRRFEQGLRQGSYRRPWFILLHLWEMHLPRQTTLPGPREPGGSDYAAAVASLDAQLKGVLAAAGDDALVVITGDHGEKLRTERYRPGTAVDYLATLLGLRRARGSTLNKLSGWTGPTVLHHLLAESAGPALKAAEREFRRPRASFSWPRRAGDLFRFLKLAPKIRPADILILKSPLRLTAMMHDRGLLDGTRARDRVLRFLRSQRPETMEAMFTRLLINSMRHNLEEGHILHVYDSLVRVPLVVRWKDRLPGGKTLPGMVRQPDILATVLDLVGAVPGPSRALDGMSFLPLLDGGPWKPRPAFICSGGYLPQVEIRGVRTPGWKYTFGPSNPDLPEELYNLHKDPGETENLAAARPGACARMRKMLESFSFSHKTAVAPTTSADGDDAGKTERILKGLGYLD